MRFFSFFSLTYVKHYRDFVILVARQESIDSAENTEFDNARRGREREKDWWHFVAALDIKHLLKYCYSCISHLTKTTLFLYFENFEKCFVVLQKSVHFPNQLASNFHSNVHTNTTVNVCTNACTYVRSAISTLNLNATECSLWYIFLLYYCLKFW